MVGAAVLIVFLFLFVMVLLVVVYLLWTRSATIPDEPVQPKQRTTDAVGGCGNCGYPVRGISGLHCPECGADLGKVGINRPGRQNQAIKVTAVFLLYSIILLIASPLACRISEPQLPIYLDG